MVIYNVQDTCNCHESSTHRCHKVRIGNGSKNRTIDGSLVRLSNYLESAACYRFIFLTFEEALPVVRIDRSPVRGGKCPIKYLFACNNSYYCAIVISRTRFFDD